MKLPVKFLLGKVQNKKNKILSKNGCQKSFQPLEKKSRYSNEFYTLFEIKHPKQDQNRKDNPQSLELSFDFSFQMFFLYTNLAINKKMKILSLVVLGCLILLVQNQCNVDHCLECPDSNDVCTSCQEMYILVGGICEVYFGSKGDTSFSKTHTASADEFSGPFLKMIGDYVLTHSFDTLDVLKIENGVKTSLGKIEGFALIIDSDIEIIEGEVWVVVNDATTLIRLLKVESGQLIEKWIMAANEEAFNRVDLTTDARVAVSNFHTGKFSTYTLDMQNEKFVKLQEKVLAEEIQSIKLCLSSQVILTARDETTVYFKTFVLGESSYDNIQTSDLQESTNAQLLMASWQCNELFIVMSESLHLKHIYQLQEGQYDLFTGIEIITSSTLESVAVNQQGDIFVTKTIDEGIEVYQYNQCVSNMDTKIYTFAHSYEGFTIGRGHIMLQNSNGLLEIWKVSSEPLVECECLQFQYRNSQGICVDCSESIMNCDACEVDANEVLTCTDCSVGYEPSENGCDKISIPVEDSYGLKDNVELIKSDTLSYERKVQQIMFTPFFLITHIQFEGLKIHFETGEFSDFSHEFITGFDIVLEESVLVVSSYASIMTIGVDLEDGSITPLDETTPESQTLHIDISEEEGIVFGLMNGEIPYEGVKSGTITNEGGRVEQVKLCNTGKIISVIEEGGFFVFKMYDYSSGENLQTEPLEEIVKVYMDATEDCSEVVFSNSHLKKVQILRQNDEGKYAVFRELPTQEGRLGKASINPLGDVIVFPILSSRISKVYKYNGCLDQFQFVTQIELTDDYPSTTAISNTQIAIGTVNGNVQLYDYVWDMKLCHDFGRKIDFNLVTMPPLSTATRSITHLHLSGSLLLATEKYSKTELYEITESRMQSLGDPFGEDTFTSDGDINSAQQCFVLSSHSKKAYIYAKLESVYSLTHTINTDFQVTSVDMSQTDCSVLLGHEDGSLTLHEPNDYDNPSASVQNPGYSILQNRLCSDGSFIALVEITGVFSFKHFSFTGNELGEQITFPDEHIDVFMDATDDCGTVVVGGITMAKASLLSKGDEGFSLLQDIPDGHPLSAVDINDDGDLILVSRIATHQSSVMYKYNDCLDTYEVEEQFESGSFDVANSLSSQYIIQGNEDGTITVTKYDWEAQIVCPDIASSTTQQSRTKETPKNNHHLWTKYDKGEEKKLVGEEAVKVKQSESKYLTIGIVATVVFIVLVIVIVVATYRSKKNVQAPAEQKTESDTNKKIESIQL